MSRRVLSLCVLAAAGCSSVAQETGADSSHVETGQEDTGPVDTDDTDTATPAEECNGVDDDDDGLVDEGFPDIDGDGVADCVDSSCDVASRPRRAEVGTAECTVPALAPPRPWEMDVQWRWTAWSGDSAYRDVWWGPISGPLVDTDGDGDTDRFDTPVVAFTTLDTLHGVRSPVLVVLDGSTGKELWSYAFLLTWDGSMALADVDRDGRNELVIVDGLQRVVALEGDGSVLWRSPALSGREASAAPRVADLDGDGDVEVVVGSAVIDGASGRIERRLSLGAYVDNWTRPTLVDLDSDGILEYLYGPAIWDPVGDRSVATTDLVGTSDWVTPLVVSEAGRPKVVDLVWPGGHRAAVVGIDPTGSTSVERTSLDAPVFPDGACSADLDGDGAAEIVVAMGFSDGGEERTWVALRSDGSTFWTHTATARSGWGCAIADVDANGRPEVVVQASGGVEILAGTTGTGLASLPLGLGQSTWVPASPVIADIDADGHAEILVPGSDVTLSASGGVVAIRHAEDSWPRMSGIWSESGFDATRVDADGQVDQQPASWSVDGGRANARPARETLQVDLAVALIDVCVAACLPDGRVRASVQISNRGVGPSRDRVPVALGWMDGGRFVPVTSTQLARLDAGEVQASVVLETVLGAHAGGRLAAMVDRDVDGRQQNEECDEADNLVIWPEPICP